MKTIRSLIQNNNFRIVAGVVIIFCAILDLSFGAAYISAGSMFSSFNMSSLYSSNQGVKSVGGFMILSGLLMVLATIFIFWDLSKNQANKMLSLISWFCSISIMIINFTCGVLTAQVYTPAHNYLNFTGFSSSILEGRMKNALNFSAAVCVFNFLLGYPTSLYLMAVANGHRQKVAKNVAGDESLNQSQVGNQNNENHHGQASQMEESQVQHVGPVENNYQYPPPQQYQMENEYRSNPFQVDMTYKSPKNQELKVEVKSEVRQNTQMEKNSNQVQNGNMPTVRQIEIQRSSYQQA